MASCAADPATGLPTPRVKDDEVVPTGDVTITVDPTADRVVVSPLIYGFNQLLGVDTERQGLLRLGGNRFTAWNWENNASNAGNDLKFQNDGYLGGGEMAGGAVMATTQAATAAGITTLLTVPIGDFVAADKGPAGDVTKVAGYLMTRFKQNLPEHPGGPTTSPDKGDAFVFQDDFVSWAHAAFPAGPVAFSLDNEPDLWSSTHKEVHPERVTYDELVDRSLRFSKMIKKLWPAAPVFGFGSYGWGGFTTLQGAPDGAGRDFVPFFLDALQTAEVSFGAKLIDYLDLHWYPEAQGTNASGAATRIVSFSAAQDNSPGVVEARLAAPRSLWDSSYVEKSWIASQLKGEAIALIPRLKAKIEAHNPGTKLAFMEWNYGGGNDISGALATADVLGIFGREGVGAAALWPIGSETYSRAALRAYRNFDGEGSAFGDIQVRATSSQPDVSVYASVDTRAPSQLVVVLVNKSVDDLYAHLGFATSAAPAAAKTYRLSALGPALRPSIALSPEPDGTLTYPLPKRSVNVVVVTAASALAFTWPGPPS